MTATVKWLWAMEPHEENSICLKTVGFEVLTAVVMKSSSLWNITPHSPLKVNRLHGVISQKIYI
jgi:hypothetical protein